MRHFTAIFLLSLFYPLALCATEISPLAMLSSPEQSYYIQIFDYTMDNIKAGDHYDWGSYSGKGSIAVQELFVSKSGANCRKFSESFTVKGQSGKFDGFGCKRVGKDGWCKLKPGNALTCSMETNDMFAGTLNGMNGVNVTVPSISGPNVNINVGSSDPATNTNNNTGTGIKTPDAKGVADSITKNAGSAAGNFMSGAIRWFGQTFR